MRQLPAALVLFLLAARDSPVAGATPAATQAVAQSPRPQPVPTPQPLPVPDSLLRVIRFSRSILDSERAVLEAQVRVGGAYRYSVDWGDGTKAETGRQSGRLKADHDYDLLRGSFAVTVEVCPERWAGRVCGKTAPMTVTVADDDVEAPSVKLELPARLILEDAPQGRALGHPRPERPRSGGGRRGGAGRLRRDDQARSRRDRLRGPAGRAATASSSRPSTTTVTGPATPLARPPSTPSSSRTTGMGTVFSATPTIAPTSQTRTRPTGTSTALATSATPVRDGTGPSPMRTGMAWATPATTAPAFGTPTSETRTATCAATRATTTTTTMTWPSCGRARPRNRSPQARYG